MGVWKVLPISQKQDLSTDFSAYDALCIGPTRTRTSMLRNMELVRPGWLHMPYCKTKKNEESGRKMCSYDLSTRVSQIATLHE